MGLGLGAGERFVIVGCLSGDVLLNQPRGAGTMAASADGHALLCPSYGC
jgi:hypothetical protein